MSSAYRMPFSAQRYGLGLQDSEISSKESSPLIGPNREDLQGGHLWLPNTSSSPWLDHMLMRTRKDVVLKPTDTHPLLQPHESLSLIIRLPMHAYLGVCTCLRSVTSGSYLS